MSKTTTLNLLFLSFILSTLLVPSFCDNKHDEPTINGMFVFGSSVVDHGNNNFLTNTSGRVDYLPYGIDFPLGATGRFTNGLTFIDSLGEKLKLADYIPPFNDPSTNGTRILLGVNYASGGSGILDITGAVTGNATNLNRQISDFERVTLPDLESQLGVNKTRAALSKYLFVVGSGGNDYVLNYFLFNTSVTVEDFTTNLTNTLSTQLKRLYSLGARKFVLLTINPNGCSPAVTTRFPTQNGCVKRFNDAFLLFNGNLKNLVDSIRPQMPGSNLVLVNTYKIISDIIRFPTRGFRNVTSPCCEGTPGEPVALCRRGGTTCTDRNEYVYFDGLHTTGAVNVVIARKALGSIRRSEVYPFNVKRLTEI